ncbi:Hypothetical protein NTJ_02334 [Nesidiocoris tenuis]|uniref:Uncharacterized protein n=1 Tax=Nesidiocoris tenuis TaxID=355587 RepID=A0ABN7AGQ2_9HEMI|nr:Hypothetical protein NTJ_02334 [Nesidiocoris tenuis]
MLVSRRQWKGTGVLAKKSWGGKGGESSESVMDCDRATTTGAERNALSAYRDFYANPPTPNIYSCRTIPHPPPAARLIFAFDRAVASSRRVTNVRAADIPQPRYGLAVGFLSVLIFLLLILPRIRPFIIGVEFSRDRWQTMWGKQVQTS